MFSLYFTCMAAGPGFEPGQPDPKSGGLPLADPASCTRTEVPLTKKLGDELRTVREAHPLTYFSRRILLVPSPQTLRDPTGGERGSEPQKPRTPSP